MILQTLIFKFLLEFPVICHLPVINELTEVTNLFFENSTLITHSYNEIEKRIRSDRFVFRETHTSMLSFSEFCIRNDLIEDSKNSETNIYECQN